MSVSSHGGVATWVGLLLAEESDAVVVVWD